MPVSGDRAGVEHLAARRVLPGALLRGALLRGVLMVALTGCDLLSPPDPPAAPTDLDAVATSQSSVLLTWTDASPDEDGFVVERKEGLRGSPAPFFGVDTLPADTETYEDADREALSGYLYRVRALGHGTVSEPSNEVAVVTHALLVIPTSTLDDAPLGLPYEVDLHAQGGDGTYTWSLVSGSLPQGITLDPTGRLVGTPTRVETTTFQLRVTSGEQVTPVGHTLRIFDSAAPEILTGLLPSGSVGAPYVASLRADGGLGTYTWEVRGGSLPEGLDITADGTILGTPAAPGQAAFTVMVTSAARQAERVLRLTISPAPSPGFDIHLVYLTPVDEPVRAAFELARARWETLITGDLAQNGGGLPNCGTFHPGISGTVDDVVIHVSIERIDGPFGILGQAGPCFLRDEGGLPLSGAMRFDRSDMDLLERNDALVATVLHEMGHVLGLGSLWERLDLISGDCVVDPAFIGRGAVSAFDAAGGALYVGAKVPIENTGTANDGSNCSHWRKSVFGAELMTPSLSSGMALSAVSVRSLGDLGYTVNTASADPYVLPVFGQGPTRAPGFSVPFGADVVRVPLRRVAVSPANRPR